MRQADALIDEIQFEINQWYCGEGSVRDYAKRIYELAGCGIPINRAKNGDISCDTSDILAE